MTRKRKTSYLGLGLLAILVLALLSYTSLPKGSVISIQNVSVKVVGTDNPLTTEIEGARWIITGIADTSESYLMFDSSVSNMSGSDYIGGDQVIPMGSIRVTIKPDIPYYALPVTPKNIMVYPETYGTHVRLLDGAIFKETTKSVKELDVTVWVFDPSMSGGWTLHTPFWITVEKLSGQNVFTKTKYFDIVGSTIEEPIVNPYDSREKLWIKDLGDITKGPTKPEYNYVVVFDENTAFLWDSTIIQDIAYDTDITTGSKLNSWSYSSYWFGGYHPFGGPTYDMPRWSDDKSPGFWYWEFPANKYVPDYWFPGMYTDAYSLDAYSYPLEADISNNKIEARTVPSPGLSLINYLKANKVHVGDSGTSSKDWVEKPPERIHNTVNLDKWLKGVEIGTILGQEGEYLKVFAEYGTSSTLYQIEISSELVDTIVYERHIVDLEIVNAFWGSTGTAEKVTIGDQDVAHYVVKNLGTVDATIQVQLSAGTAPVQILPGSISSWTISPGGTHDFEFVIKNVNTEQNIIEGSLTATASSGPIKKTDTSLAFILPPRSKSETILPVKVVDINAPDKPIAGIDVWLSFGSTTLPKGTSDENGLLSFHFGQSYEGTVTLKAENSTLYEGKVVDTTVTSGLNPTFYLRLVKHGETPPLDWTQYLPWVIVLVVLGGVGITKISKSRKKKAKVKKFE